MQEEKRKISNKINGLYCWYKLHRISSNVLGALLLLDFSADFLRLRRGIGKQEKDQTFPFSHLSHLSQLLITGNNRMSLSKMEFLSMGSKVGSCEQKFIV